MRSKRGPWKHILIEHLPEIVGWISIVLGVAGLVDWIIPYPFPTMLPSLPALHDSISSELFGIGVTVLVIDAASRRREKREQIRREQERLDDHRNQLVREMASPDSGIALRAVNELRAKGWLSDGSLRGADLEGTRLEDGVFLAGANLSQVNFRQANLRNANLISANLEGSDFGPGQENRWRANEHAHNAWREGYSEVEIELARVSLLRGANLSRADLERANLDGAYLGGADLRGARLLLTSMRGTNCEGADLRAAMFFANEVAGASFFGTNLQGATLTMLDLENLDFTGAILSEARLGNAWLNKCNLARANLYRATLEGAQLDDAILSEETVLPDGTFWNPSVDLGRFTDRHHPEFVQYELNPPIIMEVFRELMHTPPSLDDIMKELTALNEAISKLVRRQRE